MKVKGPIGMLIVGPENIKKTPKNYYVKDEYGNTLFTTKDYEGADVAIQWALDYQSSEQKVKPVV